MIAQGGPAAPPRRAFAQSLALLRSRRFGTFCVASLLSNLGTWAQQVAEPWLLLSLGASAFLIGLDNFALAAPVWLLTLPGGMLADWSDRRRIIALCQSIQMLCPAALILLLLTGAVRPWMVIALSAIVGVTDALSMPSFQTIVPSIVERRQIAVALALNATQFNLSRILGPALAGLLMASLGAVACFALNAASYLPFIWVALWILPRGRTRPPASSERQEHDLSAGLRAIARAPVLRGALITVLTTSVLCGPLIVFCPVLVKEALKGGVGDFSLAIGAFGAGGLAGAAALLGVDQGEDRRRLSSLFAAGYGTVLVLAGLAPGVAALAALMVLAGIAMSVSNTSANALLQATVSPALRGRAVSLYMLALRGGASVGSLLTGLSVHLFGVREALIVNGALAFAAQIVIGRQWRRAKLPQAPA